MRSCLLAFTRSNRHICDMWYGDLNIAYYWCQVEHQSRKELHGSFLICLFIHLHFEICIIFPSALIAWIDKFHRIVWCCGVFALPEFMAIFRDLFAFCSLFFFHQCASAERSIFNSRILIASFFFTSGHKWGCSRIFT